MRYEGKTEADAVEAAAQAIGVRSAELKYRIIRDEKSFWGGRVVEIELEEPERVKSQESKAESPEPGLESPAPMDDSLNRARESPEVESRNE